MKTQNKVLRHLLRKVMVTIVLLLTAIGVKAQGWPADYDGVMLQGFYWDSFRESKWTTLEQKADMLAPYFNLIWIPQSGNCGGKSMGYDDLYWFSDFNSSFGSESELRSMIKTFRDKGIGTIADVVINHRNTLTSWTDFPVETYKGVTYEMRSTDICADDDNKKTLTWANQQNPVVKLSSRGDSGEGWDGMRDLDHYSDNVQTIMKAYLHMLLEDFGYAGFRYDMVKGYASKFTGIYNADTKPTYSVGEYFDGNISSVKNWINGTKVDGKITSAAFDFPIRYAVRNAINGNWNSTTAEGLVTDAAYKQYAISFVENHDTEYRSSTNQQDPIRKDTLAANAFILASCGTPCVFYKHWRDYPTDIEMMINARRLAGITNTSATKFNAYRGTQYNALTTEGKRGTLLAVMGPKANTMAVPTGYTEIISGYRYRYMLSNNARVAWVDLPSGSYEDVQKARLVAVSDQQGAQLVYTTDGTEPTANSRKVASGTTIDIPVGTTTLKVGLLVGTTVSAIVTRTYQVTLPQPFTPYDITVCVNIDNTGWSNVNFWAWEDQLSENLTTSGKWPGDRVTTSKTVGDRKWYYQTYRIKSKDYMVSLVFSTGTGSSQTVDVTDLQQDSYLEITTDKDGQGHYVVKNVTSDYTTGINSPVVDANEQSPYWYDLQGRRTNQRPTRSGLYIHQGKKIVIK